MNNETRILDQKALQVAKRHMGLFAWPTILLALAATAGYAATIYAALTQDLSLWIALPIVSLLVYALYTPLHEAVHKNISGGQPGREWMDRLVGIMAGTFLGVPYTMHRAAHFMHHSKTNSPELDPDYHYASDNAIGVIMGGLKSVPAQYRWYLDKVWHGASRSDKLNVAFELLAIVGSRVGLIAAGFVVETLVLGVLASLIGLLFTVTIFAWLVHHPHEDQERYKNTSTIVFDGVQGKIITGLWLYQNYHSIHHLFPRVPFYQYTRVFDEIRGIMIKRGAPIYERGRVVRAEASLTT